MWIGGESLPLQVTTKHGGMTAAFFVLVVEELENLAYLANASNLVLYLTQYMHYTPAESANSVTNFMGTAFLLALVGGFFSDSFLNTYNTYLITAIIEFLCKHTQNLFSLQNVTIISTFLARKLMVQKLHCSS